MAGNSKEQTPVANANTPSTYQAHPNAWVLGAAGNSGAPKVHGTSKRRPTLEEIDAGFEKVTEDTNWFGGGGAAAALRRRGMPVAAE